MIVPEWYCVEQGQGFHWGSVIRSHQKQLVAKNHGVWLIKINCLTKDRCQSCSSAGPLFTLEAMSYSDLFAVCSLCAQDLMGGLWSERGMSRVFLLFYTFYFCYPSPGEFSIMPNLAAAPTWHIVKGNFNPFSSACKSPPSLSVTAPYNCSCQKSTTSRFWGPTNITEPILATSYTCWWDLIAKAKQESVLVDGLDVSNFPEAHGFGDLDKIYPVVKGILNHPPNFLTSGARVRDSRGFNNQREH